MHRACVMVSPVISAPNVQKQKAIVFIDVQGSTAMWSRAPERALRLADDVYARVTGLLRECGGQLVKLMGDAVMLAFDDLASAVRFSVMFQAACAGASKRCPGRGLTSFRIGVAHGPVHVRAWEVQGCPVLDYLGPTVNIAARLEAKVCPLGGVAVHAARPADLAAVAALVRSDAPLRAAVTRTETVTYRDSCAKGVVEGAKGVVEGAKGVVEGAKGTCRSVRRLRGVAAPLTCIIMRMAPAQ